MNGEAEKGLTESVIEITGNVGKVLSLNLSAKLIPTVGPAPGLGFRLGLPRSFRSKEIKMISSPYACIFFY